MNVVMSLKAGERDRYMPMKLVRLCALTLACAHDRTQHLSSSGPKRSQRPSRELLCHCRPHVVNILRNHQLVMYTVVCGTDRQEFCMLHKRTSLGFWQFYITILFTLRPVFSVLLNLKEMVHFPFLSVIQMVPLIHLYTHTVSCLITLQLTRLQPHTHCFHWAWTIPYECKKEESRIKKYRNGYSQKFIHMYISSLNRLLRTHTLNRPKATVDVPYIRGYLSPSDRCFLTMAYV